MIDLTERINSFSPERALLMSYCVGLPFFEQDVLPRLQETGEGRVTVLLSEGEYQSSFADFVTGAGIRYRFNPMRLPKPYSKFHPKLYLLLKAKEARLLVASANLTPSGFQSNLEIMDELSLTDDGRGDLRAFSQFAQMLRSLGRFARRTPKPVARELEDLADRLSLWSSNNPSHHHTGPHFLHSIEEPLLQQLLQLVPSARIDEIVAVSPFFDEHSRAILELATAYPTSVVRLIKASDKGSLAGGPLLRLKHRVVVDELTAVDDRKNRRLHAKVLILRGSGQEWVISGSANLTRAAWLVAAKHGGNVEAIIVREYDHKLSARRLLQQIKTHRVNLQKLCWQPKERSTIAGPLTIVDATLEGRQILILLEVESPVRELRFAVVIAQEGKRTESAPTVTVNDDGSVSLRVRFSSTPAQAEIPIVVTVQARSAAGNVMTARSWVAVPSALSLTATQRGVRDSTRQLCQKVFADDNAASAVADAIGRFLEKLADVSPQPKGVAAHGAQGTTSEGQPDRPLLAGEFIISDEELGRLRDATTRTAKAMSNLVRLLEKVLSRLLILADHTEAEDALADVTIEEEELEEEEQLEEPTKDETENRELVKAEELLDELTERFESTAREAVAQTICPEAVPFVLNLPGAAIGYMLLHAQVRETLKLGSQRELAYFARETLQNLLSIEGVLLGTAFGWLVRARASDQCRSVLQDILKDKVRVAQLFASVAAGLALGGDGAAAFTADVLGGLHFVTGEMPGKEINPEMQSELRKIAAATNRLIPVEKMERVLGSYLPKQLSALRSAQRWSRGAVNSYCQALESESGISCGNRHMSLPANTVIQLKRGDKDVICPFCQRVIVPIRQDSLETERVLTWFESTLADIQ